MTGPIFTRYRIVDEHPYLSREDEFPNLTLAEAAGRMEDLTGVKADVILADFDEGCNTCDGTGSVPGWPCAACHGTGKRSDPWEWVDDENGREVTMRLEVTG